MLLLCPSGGILRAESELKAIASGRVWAIVGLVPPAAAQRRRLRVSASLLYRRINLRRGLRPRRAAHLRR